MASLDAHSAEQDLLLNAFHLSQRERNEASADDPWSAAGRVGLAVRAVLAASSRPAYGALTSTTCSGTWAAATMRSFRRRRCGCRCVGLDIDADCIRDATAQAAACGWATLLLQRATCWRCRALRNGVAGAEFAGLGAALQHAAAASRCRRPLHL